MSYTSILYACSNNICSWSADDVIHVLLQGHILHTNQLNFFHRNFPDLDHRLAIDELPKIILMGNTNFFIYMYQNFVNEFTNILHQKDNIDGFLVRFSDYTSAIIHHDDNYHLFDSHARGTNGFPDQPWKAVAIYFPNSVSV